jgi:hypothetical protein
MTHIQELEHYFSTIWHVLRLYMEEMVSTVGGDCKNVE